MKKNIKYVIIAAIIAILIAVVIFFSKRKESRKITHTFPSTIVVKNSTKHEVDTIVMVLANKVFMLDTINIIIAYMPMESPSSDNMIFKAFVLKNKFKEKHYLIYLSKSLSKGEYKKILSHELIHLHQYEMNELVQINNFVVIFKGDTVDIRKVNYEDRLQEIDAFSRELKIQKELNNLLYE